MGRRVDLVAWIASMLALAMFLVYVGVMRRQDEQPAAWVMAVLLVGAAAAGYGGLLRAPFRRAALLVAGLALAGLGLLAILTIGLPIIAAGGLCVVAALRQRPAFTA